MNISSQASLPSSGARFASSWSGGKDGCFARWISSQSGAKPACLLTMLKDGEQRTSAHGLHRDVLQAQADCLDTPIIFGSAGFGGYEQGLKKALATAINEYSVSHLAFGDIDLDAHKDWYDRILEDTAIQTCYPLWHYNRKQLLKDMFLVGQETMIVSVKNESLNQSFLGRILTPSLADEIEAKGICPTGEEGDFHSLVINGPDFKQPLSVKKSDIWQDDWGHSVLELTPA
ncbi:MAG: hypothetical protein ACR2PX_19010 [Endozoicomonas sp.]|uniref:Dph6-related ATP pyrophosphatase n=1 Tax=Endozoicomonas sp. TaxID=1892382 RepID=UPI003D9B372B